MIATITRTGNSNTASAPLPTIPRRSSSARPALTPSPSCPLPTRASLSAITFTPATPPKDSEDSPSSTRRRPPTRTRNPNALYPPELSAPSSSSKVPPRRPMLYTPGMPLRLSIDSLKSPPVHRTLSDSAAISAAASHVYVSPASSSALRSSSSTSPEGEPPLIRKKSGQVVRSSLKSSRSSSRSGSTAADDATSLTLLNPDFPHRLGGITSKSEPTTPTASKAVHFDTNLEQIKLFLAEQKPLAVSRDGSPTGDDTSGTDSDFPRFIYGRERDPRDKNGAAEREGDGEDRLVMHTNMPPRTVPFFPATNVSVESLTLSPDASAIQGSVLVRNIAFSKTIGVRFTFDHWQTTSEVLAKWKEPASACGDWDRFAFSIRLNDLILMKREEVERKRLELAVRYVVDGRHDAEMWDNNGGGNYVATFVKVKTAGLSAMYAPPAVLVDKEEREGERGRTAGGVVRKKGVASGYAPAQGRPKPAAAVVGFSDDEMTDLESKLQKAAAGFRPRRISRSPSPTDAAGAGSAKGTGSGSGKGTVDDFKSGASFAARYDFANSLKSPWRPSAFPNMHGRTQSFPLASSSSTSTSSTSTSSSTTFSSSSSPFSNSKGATSPPPWPQPPKGRAVLSSGPTKTTTGKGYAPMKTLPVLGSPRDIGEDAYHPHTPSRGVGVVFPSREGQSQNLKGVPFPLKPPAAPTTTTTTRAAPNVRPVHREERGYFDLVPTPTPASIDREEDRTPTPTPMSVGRFNSFPPLGAASASALSSSTPSRSTSPPPCAPLPVMPMTMPAMPMTMGLGILDGSSPCTDSEDSTATGTGTGTESETSETVSPVSSPVEGIPGQLEEGGQGLDRGYRELLTKFCFFTGPGSLPLPSTAPAPAPGAPSETETTPRVTSNATSTLRAQKQNQNHHGMISIPRPYSASDVDLFFDVGATPTPTRSRMARKASRDDLDLEMEARGGASGRTRTGSGSLTPTPTPTLGSTTGMGMGSTTGLAKPKTGMPMMRVDVPMPMWLS